VIGFSNFDDDSDILWIEIEVFHVLLDFFSGVRVKFIVFCLQVKQGRDVDSLRINGSGIDSRGVVCKPGPVVVALPDRQFKFLFLDFNIKKHQIL